jgi:signal transduction histidine kinase
MVEGVIVYDQHGRALWTNPRALELLQLTEGQIRGVEPVPDTWRACGTDGEPIALRDLPVRTALRTQEPVANQLIGVTTPDGTVWLWANVQVGTFGQPDEQVRAVATFWDATEAKLARDLDRAIRELATRLVATPLGDLDGVIGRHLEVVGEACGADRAFHVVLDRQAGRARVDHDWPEAQPSFRQPGGVPLDLVAPVLADLRRGRASVIQDGADLQASAAARGRLERWGVVSAVGAPVMVEDRLDGLLVVGWSVPRVPQQQVLDFVVVAADLLSARLQRERVHADLQAFNASLDDRVRERSEELARERRRSEALVDAFPDLLVELDPMGTVVAMHAPETAWPDTSRLVGRQIASLAGPAPNDDVRAALHRLRDAGGVEVVDWSITVDGVDRVFECRLMRQSDGGILAVIRDVTGEAERERLGREQQQRLARANDELRHLVAERDRFLASVSHELRTPLHAVLGHAEMLLDDPGSLSEHQRGSLAAIQASGQDLLDLINDLLDLSTMRVESSTLELGDVDVDDLCLESIDVVSPRAGQRGLQFEYVNGLGPRSIRADGRRLRQVLVNLLDNAIKFTEPGGSFGLQVFGSDPGSVSISVWDTGAGIAPGDHARVFEPFTQLGTSRDQPGSGSGLGLALVERLVALHGGEVLLDAELGRGSRFTVVLPEGGPGASDEADLVPGSQAGRTAAPRPPSRPRTNGTAEPDAVGGRVARRASGGAAGPPMAIDCTSGDPATTSRAKVSLIAGGGL